MFGRKQKRSQIDDLRDFLFGDLPLEAWPPEPVDESPWSTFVSAREDLGSGRMGDAIANWLSILTEPGLESRHYLQAWHFLRQVGEEPSWDTAKQVLGVVVEVALPEGLDILAAYDDGTARYYNYSGAGVIWDRPDVSLDASIDVLIAASTEVVRQIGPWEGERPAAPTGDEIRLSFLTPNGLHFGQGPADSIASDPLSAPVLQAATLLMADLLQKTEAA